MAHQRFASETLSLLALLALAQSALAQSLQVGIEFQVSTYTTNGQRHPALGADAEGDFVVTWTSPQDGGGDGVFARRYASAGVPLASEFQVNTYTTDSQSYPSVAAEADGDFVIVWESAQDGSLSGVFARRFSSAGASLASEFQVNTYTTSSQRQASVGSTASGDFIVAWHSDNQDGAVEGIFARRFSSAGTAVASEFQVNTYTTGGQTQGTVAADADGDFVIAWRSLNQDGSGFGVFARRFSSAGVALATELQVNTYTTGAQREQSVAASASGDFLVAWHSDGQSGGNQGIFARRFSSAGAALATEFQVNTYTLSNNSYAWVTRAAGGDFVVTWDSPRDGDSNGVFARRFSNAGAALTAEFQVNTYTTDSQRYPVVAGSADGDFVVAWRSTLQDGSGYGVFAQRFSVSKVLDIDGNGLVKPLTDGLLVLRFLFGFTGTTLTSGAVDTQRCTRCNAAAIEPYLQTLI